MFEALEIGVRPAFEEADGVDEILKSANRLSTDDLLSLLLQAGGAKDGAPIYHRIMLSFLRNCLPSCQAALDVEGNARVWLARTLLFVIATAVGTAAIGQEFRTITLMSWNVENLFDTVDDPANPFDDTFLPRTVKDARPGHAAHCRQVNPIPSFARECIAIDWTDEKLARKLQAIADVIRAVRPQPDVIILPELENPAILTRLNTEFLADLGYTTAIELDTTVTDLDRGIDVGILSRLPSVSPPTAHKVDFGNDADLCRATRDIVAAPLALPDGRTLHSMPSTSHPGAIRSTAASARCAP